MYDLNLNRRNECPCSLVTLKLLILEFDLEFMFIRKKFSHELMLHEILLLSSQFSLVILFMLILVLK